MILQKTIVMDENEISKTVSIVPVTNAPLQSPAASTHSNSQRCAKSRTLGQLSNNTDHGETEYVVDHIFRLFRNKKAWNISSDISATRANETQLNKKTTYSLILSHEVDNWKSKIQISQDNHKKHRILVREETIAEDVNYNNIMKHTLTHLGAARVLFWHFLNRQYSLV